MNGLEGIYGHELRGTSEYLLETLGEEVSDDVKRYKAWPKAANTLSRRLNRLAPLLREAGIEYSEDEVGREKKKIKILKKVSLDSDDRGEEGPQSGTTPDERPVSDGGDAPPASSETYEAADDGHVFDWGLDEDQDPEEGQPHD